MKVANTVGIVSMLCLAAAGAGSGQSRPQSHQEFICTAGPVRKVVSIFNSPASDGSRVSGGCRVDYTKNGQTRTVWSSKSDYASCAAKAVALVTKLARGNYSCKPDTVERPDDIGPAR
jgi:hypothetical protein